VYPIALPQPETLRHRRLRGIRTTPAGLPRLFTLAYQLEAGGGQRGVRVFTGRRRVEVVARDVGLGWPKHPMSDSG
jgi:hypothetical protein